MAKIMNPELRQTLHTISRNLESANETAQENIYTFTQLYIDPCLSGIRGCLKDCTAPCFPGREEHLRRKRGRSRGRPELDFDFYDDWDEDDGTGNNLLGWGNDELDSLLAGSSRQERRGGQPRRQRAMSYGSRGRMKRSPAHKNSEEDPTIIPSSSYLGFLERLPFRFGGTLRYKPSAADLQEHPGRLKGNRMGEEPLLDANDESDQDILLTQGRQRSATVTSRSTTNSLSSRGDLIPSDEEADAVPLDDEFAMALARRNTGVPSEDHSSGRSRTSKQPRTSRTSTRTLSSLSTKNSNGAGRVSSIKSPQVVEQIIAPPVLSLAELQKEEEQARIDEQSQQAKKREAALKLAVERGLSSTDKTSHTDPHLEARMEGDEDTKTPPDMQPTKVLDQT
ncbi:hypothetical protein GJ744_004553 [Endocarpon pusillum]|uniref:Uncharacterized protein n=1 Tax=Endocarpon pusillum TaxID=364733 RepID=A0A8H7EAF9_9EURO|nr:hypothetical protein GJ744_004553 [Endocarpon pusillum]